jgi:putative GTP pyrophosphokinase
MLSWSEFTRQHSAMLSKVRDRLEKANNVFQSQLGYAPIEGIKSRIKSEESARSKLKRKGLAFDEKSISGMTDIAGMRVVCRFIDDIPDIVGLVRSWEKPALKSEGGRFVFENMMIVEEQDFVSRPKESGYRSYHLVCKAGGLFFELQVRTIAMDFWASTEHMLKYKFNGEVPPGIRAQLKSIAEIGMTLDLAMNDIRESVKIGTTKERIMLELDKALILLEENNLSFKAEKYRERLSSVGDDLNALKSLAIEAKEAVPRQFWRD